MQPQKNYQSVPKNKRGFISSLFYVIELRCELYPGSTVSHKKIIKKIIKNVVIYLGLRGELEDV